MTTGTQPNMHEPDRRRIARWAIALAVAAVLVYGTFIVLVGVRGGG